VGTLDKFKVPEKEKNEVLTALAGLKGDIVGHSGLSGQLCSDLPAVLSCSAG
jgi:hypothetical protein